MTTPEEPRDALPDRAAESPADDLAAPSPTASDDAGPNVSGASSPGPGVAEPDAADSAAVDPADAAANDAAPAAAAGVTRNLPPGASSMTAAAAPSAQLRALDAGDRTAAESRSRTARTWGQRALLVLNCIVITACFVGAGALLVARHYANNVHKVDLPSASPSSDPIATSDAVVSVATSTAPRDTSAGVPVSTVVGDTAPVATGSTAPPETFPPADPTAKNFLITGADNNACIEPDSPYAGAFGDREAMGERSDTIMVMRIDPANTRAAILSFPRDLWVEIAGSGRSSRLNSAYVKDDPRKLIETILLNFQVGIDHFVQVDFCAFKRLVDAVDGVAVPFTFPARDGNTGLDVPEPGCFTFDGDHALAYVRSRHYEYLNEDGEWREDPASDLGRISRQQDFIRRALDAALDKGIYNPSVARGLIDIATKSIVVDKRLTASKMLELFGILRDFQPGAIRTYQIEATPETISGNAVLLPKLGGENMQSIIRIFQGIAPLAEAPEQVFESTTTTDGDNTSDTSDASATSDSSDAPGSSGSAATTTSVAPTTDDGNGDGDGDGDDDVSDTTALAPTTSVDEGPEENVKGIVPPDDETC